MTSTSKHRRVATPWAAGFGARSIDPLSVGDGAFLVSPTPCLKSEYVAAIRRSRTLQTVVTGRGTRTRLRRQTRASRIVWRLGVVLSPSAAGLAAHEGSSHRQSKRMIGHWATTSPNPWDAPRVGSLAGVTVCGVAAIVAPPPAGGGRRSRTERSDSRRIRAVSEATPAMLCCSSRPVPPTATPAFRSCGTSAARGAVHCRDNRHHGRRSHRASRTLNTNHLITTSLNLVGDVAN